MAEIIDAVVDHSWQLYDYYRGFWFTGSRRLALERAVTYAFREGQKYPMDVESEKSGPERRGVRVVFEQHRSLMMCLATAAVSATGSAAVTSSVNGWVAGAIAWGGTVAAVIVAGVRAWIRG